MTGLNPYVLGTAALAERAVTPVDESEQIAAELEAAESPEPVLRSEVTSISDSAWTAFVRALKVADLGVVSEVGELGMFALRPRRLADLGLMKNIKSVRSPGGLLSWKGDFVEPLTRKKFLKSAQEQYNALSESVRRYIAGLCDGSVPLPEGGLPVDMSLSGALGVLHRAGPRGLVNFSEGERFPMTEEIFTRTNGIF